MSKLYLLHAACLCLSLAQVPPRSVSYEILPTLAPGQDVSVLDRYEYAPYIRIESPIYTAILNRETRCCVWMQFTVRAEDVEADNETHRRWWVPRELMDHTIPDAWYRGSGYDRGHLRSIQMSRGSRHFEDVNCLAVIVPESPALNRGDIVEIENSICDLAEAHGWCRVTITLTGDIGDLAGPCQIPQTIRYVVESPAGRVERSFQNGGE